MGKKEVYKQDLSQLLDELLTTGDAEGLTEYLVSNSNLPGPRANLELAQAFIDVVTDWCSPCVHPAPRYPDDAAHPLRVRKSITSRMVSSEKSS